MKMKETQIKEKSSWIYKGLSFTQTLSDRRDELHMIICFYLIQYQNMLKDGDFQFIN